MLITFACKRREGNYEPNLALADKSKQKKVVSKQGRQNTASTEKFT